jgi:hypothetical protein
VVDALVAGPRVLARRAQILGQVRLVVDQGRASAGARVPQTTGEAPEVTAEGVIGAVFAVLQNRLLARGGTVHRLLGSLIA